MLLDTSLLVLLVVGLVTPDFLRRHKRTRDYTFSDLELLLGLLNQFEKIVVPSYVVAEASNHLSQTSAEIANGLRHGLALLVRNELWSGAFRERQVTVKSLSSLEFVPELGITDAAIMDQRRTVILSDDGPLCARLRGERTDPHQVIYFSEERARYS